MASIAWRELMGVGIPEIDADHRTLLTLANDLYGAIGDEEERLILGSVLKAVCDFADSHFAREETLMAAVGYPGQAAHIAAHDRLRGRAAALARRYDGDGPSVDTKDCLDFLHHWVVDHICTADMDYRGWVVGRPGLATLLTDEPETGLDGAPNLDWRQLSLLLVDDNARFRRVMRTILEGIGVRNIAEAPDIDTAKVILDAVAVDAVVTDGQIGGRCSRDLLGWMRERPNWPRPVVVVLCGAEQMDRAAVLAAGADEILEKPVSARRLLTGLARLLIRIPSE